MGLHVGTPISVDCTDSIASSASSVNGARRSLLAALGQCGTVRLMEPLDPDDPRPPFQQVANALRAAIRTRKFEPGEQLPSLSELAKGYGVSLMTVQKAIAVLRDESLVISRQG